VPWHAALGCPHPRLEHGARVGDASAISCGPVKGCPLGGSGEDVVGEDVDVLPAGTEQWPPDIRWYHRCAELGADPVSAERDRRFLAPGAKGDATAGEERAVGMQVADGRDRLLDCRGCGVFLG